MKVSRLEKARAEKDLTQTQLAELSGVDQAVISRAEHGRPPQRYAIRFKLARALGVNPDDLFSENGDGS